ncbi:hypothetical protein UFOVP1365_17 [uncultured Caudovirales phage]|uniref:Major capsid protein n=1 Tax=uncultured Caudovirales phage TaxID=2100421 RepID=A0A6J5RX33_9CAUD|nr:hypothetical protein UFOVP1365_17 [uncultured Caudovirales phage]
MADVGLGQVVTTTGRARSKVLKSATLDSQPILAMMKEVGGIRRIDGGRTVVEEAKSGQNGSVAWVGEAGSVSLADSKVLDAAEFNWSYQLGSVVWTLAERLKNSGSSDTKIIDVVAGKFDVLEDTMKNYFHEGVLSNGTGTGGLQLGGLAALVSTTPTTGTVGGIDRSNANAAWHRNQKFDTANDWSDGAVDASNVKRFLDKGLNATARNSKLNATAGVLGQIHFEALTQATQAIQVITNESSTGKVGFDKQVYRGVPMYFGGGINYSGASALTTTRTYLLNLKPGGVNLVFHEKAEFEMLEPVDSNDQAAISRLMFTMAAMTIGGLAKTCWVGFD